MTKRLFSAVTLTTVLMLTAQLTEMNSVSDNNIPALGETKMLETIGSESSDSEVSGLHLTSQSDIA